MRKLNQIMLLIMTVSLVTLTSCSKDDDGGSGGNAPSGTLTAKVDGTNYQSMEISSSATVSSNPSGQSLIIIATNSDGNAFSFTILGYDGVGTYSFDGSVSTGVNVASYSETTVDLSNPLNSETKLWQAPYENLAAGTISISEETDTKLIGTFEFNGKNVGGDQSIKNITNGSFNLGKQTL
ncbi:hypothetical protein SAMN04489796_10633 [Winogradskyella thalassocola]|uniref:Uncharacterized protein n=2 Tax=Winogradskyella thalassocola TaxID=262004 RepID=A0A1G8GUG0_9FLAO|nr:hypothetical protein SAMN04489796_10633 [Winogradskyella thalassocola]